MRKQQSSIAASNMTSLVNNLGTVLAVAAHGAWWEIIAALATPAIAVAAWVSRQISRVTNHLQEQDRRHYDLRERLSRVEGAVGLHPKPPGQPPQ